ncbi:hypothetical protein [Chryseomicrobium aureum]|uniref:hypothetical protein n=1 Tax=Chryseomicrobium aureum TaxID=1441723 RepID=UPI001EF77AA7|nr:hypothetical protein [Chryseomicrobium aureum]
MSKGILHHVELYVSDLKRSTEFWGWLLEELGYELFQLSFTTFKFATIKKLTITSNNQELIFPMWTNSHPFD